METRNSLREKTLHLLANRSIRTSMSPIMLNACLLAYSKGLEHGYFLGLKDAEEIMASRKLPWKTGTPTGKRILAGIDWNSGEMYYEVLYYHEYMGLKHPAGYYDSSCENVPNFVIKQYVEF